MVQDVNSDDYVELCVGVAKRLGTLHTKMDSVCKTFLLGKLPGHIEIAFGDVKSLYLVTDVSESSAVVTPAASKIEQPHSWSEAFFDQREQVPVWIPRPLFLPGDRSEVDSDILLLLRVPVVILTFTLLARC